MFIRRFTAIFALILLTTGVVWIGSNNQQATHQQEASRPIKSRSTEPLKALEESNKSTPYANNPTEIMGATIKSVDNSVLLTGDASLWSAFEKAQRKIRPVSEYQATIPENEDALFLASNSAAQLRARFCNDGVRLLPTNQTDDWQVEIGLANSSLTSPNIDSDDLKINYRHQDLTEHFSNTSEGIEHSFTVPKPASSLTKITGLMTIPIMVNGLKVQYLDNGDNNTDDLQFSDESGNAILSYTNLKAWDSEGTTLAATMMPTSSGLNINVDVSHAVYPVYVDPVIATLESTITPTSAGLAAEGDGLGYSVAISQDIAIIGAPYDSDNGFGARSGSAYIFRRTSDGWVLDQKILPSSAAADDHFGIKVSVFEDRAAISATGHKEPDRLEGTVYIYKNSPEGWLLESILTAPEDERGYDFGSSLSLQGDTLLIGQAYNSTNVAAGGAVFVFIRVGTTWSLQAVLTAQIPIFAGNFGSSVSLRGNLALIGAPGTVGGVSNSYIFTRTNGVWSQTAKLKPSDSHNEDFFGTSVCLVENLAVIGAERHSAITSQQGAAYVYELVNGTWTQTAKFTPPVGNLGTRYFGQSVAARPDTIIVGSPEDGAGRGGGRVYIYSRASEGWTLNTTLSESDEESFDSFGKSLSIEGDTLLVGTPGKDDNERGAGVTYIFTEVGGEWVLQNPLLAGNSGDGDQFGISVDIDNQTAVIGSSFDNDNGYDAGCVYIFTQSGGGNWVEHSKIYPSDGRKEDKFGTSVSIDENQLIIGAVPLHSYCSAYIFEFDSSNWNEIVKLTASDSQSSSFFGCSVSIDGDNAIVGASSQRGPDGFTGAVYTYERTSEGWTQQSKLTPSDGIGFNHFGTSVCLDGSIAAIGSILSGQGAVYIYQKSESGWAEVQKVTPDVAGVYYGFGHSVDLVQNRLAIGYPTWGSSSGTAYIFDYIGDAFVQSAQLLPGDPKNFDDFGYDVCLVPNGVVVGCPRNITSAGETGATYHFMEEGVTWREVRKLSPDTSQLLNKFGTSLAYSNNQLIIGASGINGLDPSGGVTTSQGAAYIYRMITDSDLGSPEWQLANGFDPDVANDESTLDSDHDGHLDIFEIFQGTARNDPFEFGGLSITSPETPVSLSITYRRSTTQSAVMGIGKWSSDLINWYQSGETNGTCSVNLQESIVDSTADSELVRVQAHVSSGDADELFYKIELIPNE